VAALAEPVVVRYPAWSFRQDRARGNALNLPFADPEMEFR